VLAWLRAWWRGAMPDGGKPVEVIVYTRQGCHLCDDAWRLLEEAGRKHALALRSIDVDQDNQLKFAYGHEVPVIAINGKVRFRGRLNRVLLERLLNAERDRY